MSSSIQSSENSRVDIAGVLRYVLRQWVLVCIAAILGAMLTFTAVTQTYRPVYTSHTTFVVSVAGGSTTVYNNLSAATTLAEVFGNLFNERMVQNKVMELAGIESFSGSVRASAVPETNLLLLSVTADSPESAYLMSRALEQHHTAVTANVIGNAVLDVLEDPQVPIAPANPMGRTKKTCVGAALCGILTAAALAMYAYLLDTVKTPTMAMQRLDMPLLTSLYHEQKNKTLLQWITRKKRGILVSDPGTSFGFTEACKRLRTRVLYRMEPKGEKVLLVGSVLENEGKSTVAANLALTLAQSGKKVLLVDGDVHKPAIHKLFSLSAEDSRLLQVVNGKKPLTADALPQGPFGLSLLCETQNASEAGQRLLHTQFAGLLRLAREQFDFVVVDTPPMSAVADAETMASFADAALLVVQQGTAKVESINDAADILRGNCGHFLGCVLNNIYVGLGIPHSGGRYGYGRYGYGHYGRYDRYGKTTEEEEG